MTSKNITRALVDLAIFLEYADQKILDTDAAIQAMEQLAERLQNLPEQEKMHLIRQLEEVSLEYGEHEGFVRALAENLDLR
ncbi:hypothetical protein [Cupriavidus sp. DL-D2]|uniref:hypothetical protein n=1 Tax=Cupriavidus sp. DL-D2 TaxID=3144974 RepID=UPI0032133F70